MSGRSLGLKGAGVVAVLVIAAGGAACGGTSSRRSATPTTSSTTSTSTSSTTTSVPAGPLPHVTDELLQRSHQSPHYEISVRIPHVEGLTDASVQARVNQQLQQQVDRAVHDFEDGVRSIDPSSPVVDRLGLQGHFDVTLLDRRLLSVRQTFDADYGGAHGTSFVQSLTYDFAAGRALALHDLFRPGADYLGFLSRESTKQLRATWPGFDPNYDAVKTGLAPKDENYSSFNLSPGQLEIVFGEYQVGPFALGMPKVRFTAAQLQPLLAPGLGWP